MCDKTVCDRCKKEIEPGTYTNDFWASSTIYDDDGQPAKAGKQSDIKDDYIITCAACQEETEKLWYAFAHAVRSGQTFHKE